MRLPGFTAEVSLYSTQQHYSMVAHTRRAGVPSTRRYCALCCNLLPASRALAECQDGCAPGSFELVGSARRCLTACARSCSKACGCNFFR